MQQGAAGTAGQLQVEPQALTEGLEGLERFPFQGFSKKGV